jgi:hypothetical protein
MRRNRKRGKGKNGGPPTLTDALGIDRSAILAPTIILPEAATAEADPIALDTLSDVPVLTDVVDVWQSPAPVKWPPAEVDAPADALDDALEADALATVPGALGGSEAEATQLRVNSPGQAIEAEATPAEPAVSDDARQMDTMPSVSAVAVSDEALADVVSTGSVDHAALREPSAPAPVIDEEFILEIPPASATAAAAAPQSAAPPIAAAGTPPALAPGSLEWDALAEEIRMQVLQRLDLFTDTGMRDQLGARLQPIVARASAELVETINHALGELVRGYVAEAIEREIESWRKRSG